jgi:hypothetical protein
MEKEYVMIDSAGFCLHNPHSELLPRIDKVVQAGDITDEDHLICSPMVLGFNFKHKAWRK